MVFDRQSPLYRAKQTQKHNILTGEPMDRRVFISSVMDGFAKQRDAARAAVELLRLRPVMAEDFGAKSHSPQQACFDGIRESNAIVLVLGRRYGFIAQSGKSVTEEEFDFARERGIPVLIFVEKVAREPEQDAFVRRLSSYEEGYHRVTFATPDELKDEIVKALNDEFRAGEQPTLSTTGAKDALDRMKWGGTRDRQRGPWLGGVILPARQRQYVSVLKLGESSFHRAVQKEAVYGKADIFNSERGVSVQESEENTAFVQLDDRGQTASLEVRADGALTYRKLLANALSGEYSIVRSFVIDREEVKSSLVNFFRFAHEFYNMLDESRMLTSFFFGGSLSGIEHKSFGRIPAMPSSGMSIASHSLPDPLSIPREPYALSRAALVDGEKSADEIVELVARAFRTARAYYAAGEGRS